MDTAILYICIEDNKLLDVYTDAVVNHNQSIMTNPYPNSGFDLFVPETTHFSSIHSTFVDFKLKCEMQIYNTDKPPTTVGFYVYPRSSLSKTPLMLANHVGIIDSGYRGNIIGAFRMLDASIPSYMVDEHTRLLQICAPLL